MLLPHVEQEKQETKFRLDIVFYPIWIQELTEGTQKYDAYMGCCNVLVPDSSQKSN